MSSTSEWFDAMAEGLGLLFHGARDKATQDKALDAYFEVLDLQRESWGIERLPVLEG